MIVIKPPAQANDVIAPEPSDTAAENTAGSDDDDFAIPIKAIVFKENSDTIEALEISVDLKNCELIINSTPVYTFDKSAVQNHNNMLPQYMTNGALVLCENPLSHNEQYNLQKYPNDTQLFYFCDYTLKHNTESSTFTVCLLGRPIYEDITLEYEGTCVIPETFFVDSKGNIVVLGMTNESLLDTEMVTLQFADVNGSLELEKIVEYTTLWEDYEVAKVLCPNNLPGSVNVWASEALQCFIYNETTKVLIIDPDNESVQCVAKEGDIIENMPFFDYYRDFYSLFDGVGYQNGIFAVTFPALNEEPGSYAAMFDHNSSFAGYLRCQNGNVSLYSDSGAELSRVEGEYYPMIYFPVC